MLWMQKNVAQAAVSRSPAWWQARAEAAVSWLRKAGACGVESQASDEDAGEFHGEGCTEPGVRAGREVPEVFTVAGGDRVSRGPHRADSAGWVERGGESAVVVSEV